MQPFMVPNVIAYPTRVHQDLSEERKEAFRPLFDPSVQSEAAEEEKVQERFDAWSKPVLQQVVDDLRLRKAYLIDDRSVEAIRQGNVGYKVFDSDSKCLQGYADTQKLCFSDLHKNPFGSDLHLEIPPDKFQLITNPEGYLREKGRNFLYGSEVSAIHASCNMSVRYPIANGDLNISPEYTASQCCQDLQNILEASF